jgi:hypothetical protein
MAKYSHVIMRQRLEIEIPDKSYQQEVQRRAHKIVEEKLHEILAPILSAEVPDDVVITLDQLHVNLAELDQNLLEEEILQKMRHKLPLIVKEQVSLAIQDPLKKRITPLPEAKLNAIKHYLTNGYFAWWMPTNSEKIIEELYLDIYRATPNTIKDLWAELGQQLPAIQRFITQFSTTTIQQSIKILHPIYGRYTLQIAEDFKNLQGLLLKMAHIANHKKIHTATKHIVLAQAMQILSGNKKFNEATFLENCLEKVAQELGITYSALLANLAQELPKKYPISLGLKSNLVHHIIRLHDTQLVNNKLNPTVNTDLSLLIKKLDGLLDQGENVNQQKLTGFVKQVFNYANKPALREILKGYLKSTKNSYLLTQFLPQEDFTKLIEAIQPNIQHAYKIAKQVWQSVILQKNAQSKLIEQLTIKYLANSPIQEQEPERYINHLIKKLEIYDSEAIEKWQPYIKRNKTELKKNYDAELINLLLTKLTTTQAVTADWERDVAKLSVENILVKTLHKFQQNNKFATHTSLSKLVNNLHNQFANLIERKAPVTPTFEKELEDTLGKLLEETIQPIGQLNKINAELKPWIHDQLQQLKLHHSANKLKIVKEALRITSSKLNADSITQVKDFFIEDLLPNGYTHQHDFITSVVERIAAMPDYKAEMLSLLKQKHFRKQIAKKLEPAPRVLLVHRLTNLPPDIQEIYQQVLLRADVLRANTIGEKQALINEIFLEIASEDIQPTKDYLIQHILLSVAHKAQLPKTEIHRRLYLAAQKYAANSFILKELQEISASASITQAESTDTLDQAFLPIYDIITSFIPSSDLASKLYLKLLTFIKKAIYDRLNSAFIINELQHKIKEIFGMLSAQQKQKLFEAIKQIIQRVTGDLEQNLKDSWEHFLQTGEVYKEYGSPSTLFNKLLGIDIKSSAYATTPPTRSKINLTNEQIEQLAENFRKIIAIPHNRKRLIASLPIEDLEKTVHILANDKSKTIVSWIHTIDELWEYAGKSPANPQQNKLVWWETALINLANLTNRNNLQKAWLTNSIFDFSQSLNISHYTLVSTLKTAIANFKSPNPKLIETQKLDNTLTEIKQIYKKLNKKEAKKTWPTQPVFQELHKLFTIGISSLGEHPATNLERLEQQLSDLIEQQDAVIKKFFFNYPPAISISKKTVHYFSASFTKQIINVLDPKAAPFIHKYLAFINPTQSDFYNQIEVEPFSWRKYTEIATLDYLLKKQEEIFNKEKYLKVTLELLNTYNRQNSLKIIQQLIDIHNKNKSSAAYTEIIELSAEIAKELEENITPSKALTTDPTSEKEQASNPLQSDQKEGEQKQKKFDEEDVPKDIKIYVKNSGLVFLWPFLEELLEKQGLLEKDKFFDKIDRTNAVHTLQYLVTEKLMTSDWRIILNKLLCGMDYNEVTFIGYYLPEEKSFAAIVLEEREKLLAAASASQNQSEKDEKGIILPIPEEIGLLKKNAEEVLNTVLEKWKTLKKLEKFERFKEGFGIQDLRKYILQRDGILQYIKQEDNTGYWHLTITWEEYDAEIKNIPWPITKIRLPFMKEDLVVFWTPN